MNRHAKPSSAGSNPSQAQSLGSLLRGAFATRGASRDANGSGAPFSRLSSRLLILCFATAAALAAFVSPALALTIDSTSVSSVTRTEATLHAGVNPEGLATTYSFEYGTTTSYGQTTTSGGAGSDSSVHQVAKAIQGLTPGVTYHYRVVADNTAETLPGPDRTFTTYSLSSPATGCPNQVFRTGTSAILPDCRAYEMVSPLDKNGGDVLGTAVFQTRVSHNQSSIAGNKITYSATTSFADEPTSRGSNQYMATRGPDGWTTRGISPPFVEALEEGGLSFAGAIVPQFKLFTPDLSEAWMTDENRTPLTSDAAPGWANLYRRSNVAESYKALTTTIPSSANTEPEGYFPEVQGNSANFDHVIFSVKGAITPDAAPTDARQVYDYSGGKLHLVSVMPDGTASPNPATAGSITLIYEPELSGLVDNAVSADGSRVFWVTAPGLNDIGSLFVRENPAEPQSPLNGAGECTDPGKACTIPIDTSNTARFWSASADGSEAIYSHGTGTVENPFSLRRFDVDTEDTTVIAADTGGVVGASDDASRVYFTSKEDLAAGATAGEWNLYLDDEGVKTFIATISPEDRTGQGPGADTFNGGLNNAGGIDASKARFRASRVTPDGQHLAFMSSRSLTGYDNTDAVNGRPDEEVYLYDADSNELACISCNPSGARPVGQEMETAYESVAAVKHPTKLWAGAWLQTRVHNLYASRALSSDGSRLFFNSFDALVPYDTNGAQDVYQWESQGTGSCQKAGGCIDLISTGQGQGRSEFVDATADGSEVFFETPSSIDPRDPGLIDIYVARVNGGFPLPSAAAGCEGETCQGVPAPPNDPTPASAAYNGPANVNVAAKKKKSKTKKAHKKKHKKAKKRGGNKKGARR